MIDDLTLWAFCRSTPAPSPTPEPSWTTAVPRSSPTTRSNSSKRSSGTYCTERKSATLGKLWFANQLLLYVPTPLPPPQPTTTTTTKRVFLFLPPQEDKHSRCTSPQWCVPHCRCHRRWTAWPVLLEPRAAGWNTGSAAAQWTAPSRTAEPSPCRSEACTWPPPSLPRSPWLLKSHPAHLSSRSFSKTS